MSKPTGEAILVTGGAGFVGANLVARLLAEGKSPVRVLDNLSRSGTERNLRWLQSLDPTGQRLEVVIGDVRDRSAVRAAARGAREIYHLAAQVAVTTSIGDPETDFDVNALGTLNVLEAARAEADRPFVLFTSTNKVYGSLHGVPVTAGETRYTAERRGFAGVCEEEPLDFHSPYGCSKGAADQYTRDYARIYDLDTVVFRMSCIAGPRQFGNEDQGWVAHFLYSVMAGNTITVCGNGLQVRDVLHVHDLVDAMLLARAHREKTRGEVYNVGGGLERTVSVTELLQECEARLGLPLKLASTAVRPGDQPLYISNTGKLEQHTGWKAKRSLPDILADIEAFWHQEIAPAVTNRLHAVSRTEAALVAERVA